MHNCDMLTGFIQSIMVHQIDYASYAANRKC
jgi:hypothetical protein